MRLIDYLQEAPLPSQLQAAEKRYPPKQKPQQAQQPQQQAQPQKKPQAQPGQIQKGSWYAQQAGQGEPTAIDVWRRRLVTLLQHHPDLKPQLKKMIGDAYSRVEAGGGAE